MGRTLVTGATGFIGSHMARLLAERGDELRLAVLPGRERRADPRPRLRARGVRRARPARRAPRPQGSHARVPLRRGDVGAPADRERLFEVNVGGTKVVLEECLRAGVERVVYTSSAAALGPAEPGKTADETQLFTAGRLGIPYVNSVHEAEVEAMRWPPAGCRSCA